MTGRPWMPSTRNCLCNQTRHMLWSIRTIYIYHLHITHTHIYIYIKYTYIIYVYYIIIYVYIIIYYIIHIYIYVCVCVYIVDFYVIRYNKRGLESKFRSTCTPGLALPLRRRLGRLGCRRSRWRRLRRAAGDGAFVPVLGDLVGAVEMGVLSLQLLESRVVGTCWNPLWKIGVKNGNAPSFRDFQGHMEGLPNNIQTIWEAHHRCVDMKNLQETSWVAVLHVSSF